jgi:hypothetical protein
VKAVGVEVEVAVEVEGVAVKPGGTNSENAH